MPKKEEFLQSKERFLGQLDVAMGGRAAEELFFGKDAVTTGCGSDLRQATSTAYQMVLMNAMGEHLLTAQLGEVSEAKRFEVEEEVKGLLDVGLEAVVPEGARAVGAEQGQGGEAGH